MVLCGVVPETALVHTRVRKMLIRQSCDAARGTRPRTFLILIHVQHAHKHE